jgi:hypothetical protein
MVTLVVLLEASSALQNVYLIISIVMALITLGTIVWGIIQKIKAGDWKGAAQDADKLLKEGVTVIDKIKKTTDGMDSRHLITDVLKDHGEKLNGLGLKGLMDTKLRELGLDDKA